MSKQPVPVLLVTGFLGAGKTTFINWLIHAAPDKKVSLILNEFGDIKLESNFIQKENIGLVTELANGCMCCVAKSDIPRVVRYTLDNAPSTEAIVIEASGLSDPDPLRDVLQGGDLTGFIRLDTIVCIVDGENFGSQAKDHPLIISQIGDADLIVLSKLDELPVAKVDELISSIGNIGVGTKVIPWNDLLKPEYFFDTNLAQIKPKSSDVQIHEHEHIDEYWYTSNHELDLTKLQSFFWTLPTTIIRAKGYTKSGQQQILIQYVGRKFELLVGDEPNVDPVTVILFLGNQLDQTKLVSLLDDCRIIQP